MASESDYVVLNIDSEDKYNKEDNLITEWHGFFMFRCPHCNILIIVHQNEVACKIFRCHPTLNPHSPESVCNLKIADNMGCTRPFQITPDNKYVLKCGYI